MMAEIIPTPRRSPAKKILFSLVVLVILFVLVEIALRVLLSSREPRVGAYDLSFHTQDGRSISTRPGPIRVALAPFTLYRILPNQKTDRFTINSLGFRGAEVPREKSDRTRVIIVGGSAAFGLGAPDDAGTIARLLEEADPGLEVINAGVPGYLSGQELAYVATSLVDLEPDWIVAYDGWNDLFDQWYSRKREGPVFGATQNLYKVDAQLAENHETKTSFGAGLRRFVGMLLSKSVLLSPLGNRMLEPGYRRGNGRPVASGAEGERYFEEIVGHYAGNLRKMQDLCGARGTRFLAVLQPEVGQKTRRVEKEDEELERGIGPVRRYGEEFPALYREFLDRASELLTDLGVEHLDVSRTPEFLDANERLFLDVVHTDVTGNRLVAGLLRARLAAGVPERQ